MRNHRSRNPAMRPIRRLLITLAVGFVGLGLATTRDDRPDQPTSPGSSSGYTHEVLQQDADMTQQMSTGNANTDSQSHRRDDQLARSQDASYVSALEQHQADIDRMLARQGP